MHSSSFEDVLSFFYTQVDKVEFAQIRTRDIFDLGHGYTYINYSLAYGRLSV